MKEIGQLGASLPNGIGSLSPHDVAAGRISVAARQERLHCLENLWIDRGRRIVIKINGFHLSGLRALDPIRRPGSG